MKFRIRKFICLFAITLLIPSVSLFSQINNPLKKEAMEFSMGVINTYFTQDCGTLFAKFSPRVYTFHDYDFVESMQELREEICYTMDQLTTEYKGKTFEDYLTDFQPTILTKKEYEEKFEEDFDEMEFEDFKILESDFFFLGTQQISNSIEEYVWVEFEVIMVRKVKGKWWVAGLIW